MKYDSDQELPMQMWRHFKAKEWDLAQNLLSEDFRAYWPQSNETFSGPQNFIEVNRIYPVTNVVEIIDSHHSYDQWEHLQKVTTGVYIHSKMPDGKEMKLYAILFFEVTDGKIASLKEYFADTYPAPEWRSHLVAEAIR